MRKTFKAKVVSVVIGLLALASTACWYKVTNYNDYIATVNNMERHVSRIEIVEGRNSSKIQQISYTVQNQIVVDFPVTVTMKLVSNDPIVVANAFQLGSGSTDISAQRQKIQALLQYRVIGSDIWETVSEFSIDTGRLPDSYPPAPYLGRNNIWPKNLKAGDQIMVRLYVTDGQWQSGDLDSLCNREAEPNPQNYRYCYEFPEYQYTVSNIVKDYVGQSDLGGGWLPHYVVVLTYSGHIRPVN